MLLPTVMAQTVQSEAEPSQSGVVVAETLTPVGHPGMTALPSGTLWRSSQY